MPPTPTFNYMASAAAIYLPFAFLLGAAMASFLTVVMDRLPQGKSIVKPRSHCESCGHVLKLFENLPVFGYLFLRGKCSSCHKKIPLHLFINELIFALAFSALFMLYFMFNSNLPVIAALVPPYLVRLGLVGGWPIFLLHAALLSALYAMTIIDIRTFTIPIEITWAITIFALLVHTLLPLWPAGSFIPPLDTAPIQPGVASSSFAHWVIPLATPPIFVATLGGLVGILIATILLHRGVLRYGFIDFDLYVGKDDDITAYPNSRGELQWELDFVAIVIAGLALGFFIGLNWSHLTINTGFPLWCATLGGSLAGYFVGAALIWAIRILGTFAFGNEAMGLGDAHLLACIGAVVGWIDPILIFFLAPFLAMFGMLLGTILGSFFKGFRRVLPYGPWLALAAVFVLFGDWWIEPFLSMLFNFKVNLP